MSKILISDLDTGAILNMIYPVGSLYTSTLADNPAEKLGGGGTWALIATRVIDTGWQDYTNFDDTYYDTTAGLTAYSFNGWRIKDNTLYVNLALKAASLANLSSRGVCQIPVSGVITSNMTSKQDGVNFVFYNNRLTGGATTQLNTANGYIQIFTPSSFTPTTLVASGSITLAPGFSITDGQTYPTEYTWQRVS